MVDTPRNCLFCGTVAHVPAHEESWTCCACGSIHREPEPARGVQVRGLKFHPRREVASVEPHKSADFLENAILTCGHKVTRSKSRPVQLDAYTCLECPPEVDPKEPKR